MAQILLKSANVQKMGAASLNVAPVEMPLGFGGGFILTDHEGTPQPSTPYRITTADGNVLQGVTDEEGKTVPVNTSIPSSVKAEFGKVKNNGDAE
ncbi:MULTISPECIES: hypothetical protein [Yersinia]|uniref:hypothetical protein n=1 Tax=Yersinia TaxID=629 RepID=UPI00070A36EF|nr:MULTISPECIES: hypothetical protein [Yersinia]MDN0127460.1 hypothetical protein [Yersinia massiliensis]